MSFFSHNNADFKTRTEGFNEQNTSTEETAEKTINLNDFLDFLNLSCHVNDMISQNVNNNEQQPAKSTIKNQNSSAVGSKGVGHSKNQQLSAQLDFELLRHNRLLNELYGYNNETKSKTEESIDNAAAVDLSAGNKPTERSLRSTGVSTTSLSKLKTSSGVLHPKLNEKLDRVLSEGILDTVLPYICPVPVPCNLTNRLKPKPKEVVEKKSSSSMTSLSSAAIEPAIEANECVATASKESVNKTASKLSVIRKKSSIISIRDSDQASIGSDKKE